MADDSGAAAGSAAILGAVAEGLAEVMPKGFGFVSSDWSSCSRHEGHILPVH